MNYRQLKLAGFSGDGSVAVTARWPDPGQPSLATRGFAVGRLTAAFGQSGERPVLDRQPLAPTDSMVAADQGDDS